MTMDPLFHTCTPYCRHDPSLRRERGGDQTLTIDFHCHMLSPKAEALVAGSPVKAGERGVQLRLMGEASVLHNEQAMMPPAMRRMSTVRERLNDMDAMGVDIQVVSTSPTQYYYWADEDLAEALVSAINENIAEQCASFPGRLAGLGSVALQHPQLAVAQLRHAVQRLGLKGVEVSSLARDMDLSDPGFEPFWKAASDLGCIVFIHPLGTTLGERLNSHYFSNLIGQPLETTIALSKLIFDGVLHRNAGVKVLAAHGGGYLPSYFGRSAHGSHVRPEANLQVRSPREALQQVWLDSLVFDPLVLRHLIDTVGASKIVLGTDYPFDMGNYDVHAFLDSVPSITAEERRLILGGNAAALLDITQGTGTAAAAT